MGISNVISDEAQDYIKQKAGEVALNAVEKAITPSNEEQFLASEEGQRFVDDVAGLRDIYEASLLQGKSDEDISSYLKTRYPEETAKIENGEWDEDESDAWLANQLKGMKMVWEAYPNLATSNKYVIDVVDGVAQYVPMTAENKNLPKTTGQYIQSVATDASLNGFPLNARGLRMGVADAMGKNYYPSAPTSHPLVASMIAPRAGVMYDDDEAKTKIGNFGRAVAGDVAEMALNFVPQALAEKALVKGGEMLYRGAKVAKMGKVADAVGDATRGLQKGLYTYNAVGTGNPISRGLKGGAENVAQALAVEGIGDTYDAFAGTDRGNGMISKEEGVDGVNALITAMMGGTGKALGNPAKASNAREELWQKLNTTKWGDKVLEQRAKMGKPWRFASDIDGAWLNQYVNGGGITTDTFAKEAYKELGDNFPKIRINPEANPIANRNARIEQRNAIAQQRNDVAQQYNKELDALNQEIADKENLLKVEGADFEPSTPDAERGVVNATKKAEANKAQTEAEIAQKEAEKFAQPQFMRAVFRNKKTGYPTTAVFKKEGKYYLGLDDKNGGYKLSPITDQQANLLGVKVDVAPKKATKVDYTDADKEAIAQAQQGVANAQNADKINAKNYNYVVKEHISSKPKDMFEGQKKGLIPMRETMGEMKLRDENGAFTPESKWYFKRNWKNLGYKSYEDCMRSPNSELQKWIDMENSHLKDGWNGEFGLGSGEWRNVADWQHDVNKRAPAKLQSELTEAEKIANTKNDAEYRFAKNNWELQDNSPENRQKLIDANAEYAMRQTQDMGHYKNPKDASWQEKAIKGLRGLNEYGFSSLGRKAGMSDYKWENIPNEGEDYIIKPNSAYRLIPEKK